ncbi:MAG: nucleoside deaminase [Alphaproteobacteria bacterium]|nr:nucleoside deaminase [Alphaproteobacteria bacterium]
MSPTRRRLLQWSLVGGGLLGPIAARGEAPLPQPPEPGPAAFARRAGALRDQAIAAGDQGFGAVVMQGGRIVGEAPSRVVTNGDPTAHAEMEAIRDAARRLGTRSLAGCNLYGSTRACPMCAAAAYWAGIGRLYSGAPPSDDGPPRMTAC